MIFGDILVCAFCLILWMIVSGVVGLVGSVIGIAFWLAAETIEIPSFLSIPLGAISAIVVIIVFVLNSEMIPSHFLSVLFAIIAGVLLLVFFIRSES